MRALAHEIIFPLVAFDGEIFRFMGSNPSGHALTVVINSIVNSIYMRLVFYSLYPDRDFNSEVRLMTYGDDNIATVSSRCQEFNQLSCQQFFKQHDIGYTTASKEVATIEFIHLHDMEFLKRKFLILDGVYLAPLQHTSLTKTLCFSKPDETKSHKYYLLDKLNNFVSESIQHGEHVYNDNSAFATVLAQNNGLSHDWTIPQSWSDIWTPIIDKTLSYPLLVNKEGRSEPRQNCSTQSLNISVNVADR
jgi:hypothetical protein